MSAIMKLSSKGHAAITEFTAPTTLLILVRACVCRAPDIVLAVWVPLPGLVYDFGVSLRVPACLREPLREKTFERFDGCGMG